MIAAALFVVFFASEALGCTNFIASPGATVDGSAFVSYSADWDGMYGELYHSPHATHAANATLDLFSWDWCFYGEPQFLGTIAQAPVTYNVVGQMNEHGVVVGETTFGGLSALRGQKGVIDYGNLMLLALQRATTAREAIAVMDSLTQKYGYVSSGECFSIADPKEAWHVEMIGKGTFELGTVWVAMRVPDGFVGAHANQARIRTFPRSDPENCMFSKDVVSFARAHGFYTGSDEHFSFSDVYSPVSFLTARGDEARVWDIFRTVAGASAMDGFLDYALGKNLSNRMPLFVKPLKKVSLNDTMMLMRSHYEGTALSVETDVGAQAFGLPYRWHPLTWEFQGHKYLNERTIATQQTAFTVIGQARSWLPRELGGIMWFGVDDNACTVWFPAYSSSTRVSAAYQGGNVTDANFEKAWWAFNLVANWAYSRWSAIYPDLFARIQDREARFFAEVAKIDEQALAAFKSSPAKAVEILTTYSENAGDQLVRDWGLLFRYLFARYRDGDITDASRPGIPSFPGYPDAWRERIVKENGDRYRVPDNAQQLPHRQ